MSTVDTKVQNHFHLDAQRFDAIYDDRKGPVARFIDNVWRGVVRKRLDLTVQTLEPLTGKTVLDVGRVWAFLFCLRAARCQPRRRRRLRGSDDRSRQTVRRRTARRQRL